jgi:hypothetical protein
MRQARQQQKLIKAIQGRLLTAPVAAGISGREAGEVSINGSTPNSSERTR